MTENTEGMAKKAKKLKAPPKEKPRMRLVYVRERLKEIKAERKQLQDELKNLKIKLKAAKGSKIAKSETPSA